jgi:site-specific DNA recombinase
MDETPTLSTGSRLMHSDLSLVDGENGGKLTASFPDDGLKAQASERLRALIEAVVLTRGNGMLAIELRGELAPMLELRAYADTQITREAGGLPRRCESGWLRGQDLNL